MKNQVRCLLGVSLILLILLTDACHPVKTRETIQLDGGWLFATDSTGQGEKEEWFRNGIPAGKAIGITVPHSWNCMQGLEKYWGKGWYQKALEIPPGWKGKRVRLQFDAVYHDAIIWVNGEKAGEHMGSGYTRFFVDISRFTGGSNPVMLVVCADNSPSAYSIPYMKSYDWSNDGGITRNVYLVATDPAAMKNVLVNGKPVLAAPGKGDLQLQVNLLDPGKTDYTGLSFKAVIREENQRTHRTIWKGKLDGIYGKGTFQARLRLAHIRWWHFDSPSLYRITVSLLMQGEVKDEYSTVFGFRDITFRDNRFVLNGERVRLAGVEWMPGSSLSHGSAETREDLERNLLLMKNVNAVYTRFHWQQDDYVFDWCDRHGILVQEEIPYWGWSTKLNDTLLALGKKQLEDMIASHFNHPSIIAWGTGNELNSHDSLNIKALKALYTFAKRLDSSRLVTYVSNELQVPLNGKKNTLPDASSLDDVMMFNEYYSTWYGQCIDSVSPALDRIHARYPGKGLVISEFGICEPVHKGGDSRRALEMPQQFAIYGSKPYMAGAIYFCLNDYRTHMGEDFTYSYPQRVHGVVDIHLHPKPSYIVLQKILCPLEITSIQKEHSALHLVVEGKKGIPSYSLRNYRFSTSKNTVTLEELKPGESKQVELEYDPKADTLYISRPTGFMVKVLPL